MIRCCLVLVSLYLVLLIMLYQLQQHFVYFPAPSMASPSQLKPFNLSIWPTGDFKGYLSQEPAEARGTVLVFHGNAGAAWHRIYYVQALTRLGYRVLLAEYPGYGGRKGKPNQQSLTEDGLNILALVQQQFNGPVYLWGESLGAGVVASMAAQLPAHANVAGLALIAPWDSLTELARYHYWYLPVSLLLKDEYNSVANLSAFKAPVAILVAEQDRIIPNRHTLALYESVSAPKSLWSFANANHNDWPHQPTQSWWAEVMAFLAAGEVKANGP